MPAGAKEYEILHIKKYPNRRFYDTTRSCHVTLQDVHDLIQHGYQVHITDSRNDSDITNSILLQILLDKDNLKLDIFPSSILHIMLKSDHQTLRTYTERIFAPYLDMMATSQKQFDTFVQQATGAKFNTPMDWANTMLQAMNGMPAPFPPHAQTVDHPPESTAPPTTETDTDESLHDLRREVAALHERIETITAEQSAK